MLSPVRSMLSYCGRDGRGWRRRRSGHRSSHERHQRGQPKVDAGWRKWAFDRRHIGQLDLKADIPFPGFTADHCRAQLRNGGQRTMPPDLDLTWDADGPMRLLLRRVRPSRRRNSALSNRVLARKRGKLGSVPRLIRPKNTPNVLSGRRSTCCSAEKLSPATVGTVAVAPCLRGLR
jgi:hypothetical protein